MGRGSRSLGVAARGLVGAVDIGSWEGGLDSWGEGGEDEEGGKRPAAAAAQSGSKAERRHGGGARAHVLRHRWRRRRSRSVLARAARSAHLASVFRSAMLMNRQDGDLLTATGGGRSGLEANTLICLTRR